METLRCASILIIINVLKHAIVPSISREIEHIVLSNVASLSLLHPSLFEPYLRMFFVFNNDPIQVKLLKLEILTNLVNTSTSPIILREFQVKRHDCQLNCLSFGQLSGMCSDDLTKWHTWQ